MCNTKWCFGDCEECEKEKQIEIKMKALETCSYSNGEVLESRCGLKTTSTKQDHCSICGYTFNYS